MSRKVGLSEFTSQRLAELRARRAEAEAFDSGIVPLNTHSAPLTSNQTSPAAHKTSTSSLITVQSVKDIARSPSLYQTSTSVSKDREEISTRSSLTMTSNSSATPVRDTASYVSRIAADGNRGHSPKPLSARTGYDTKYDEDDSENLGFACLPEQMHRKAIKKGFDFTLMVVGQSGLGKSTLITSMFFNKDLYCDRRTPDVEDHLTRTMRIEKRYLEIEEHGVKLRLTIIDTPGYGDAIDSTDAWQLIEDYILHQFHQYLEDESGINRRNIQDNRVHCCLYFLSPVGRGLQQLDVEFMKRIHNKVNIIPIIAKADTLTAQELQRLKIKIMEDVERHKIKIYELPQCDSDEDDEVKKRDDELRSLIPFAVVGSNTIVEVNGKKVKGRVYPWGVVEVDSPRHSDSTKLRQFLVSTHMQDLKDVTRDIHYENYRAGRIKEEHVYSNATEADVLLKQKEEEIQKMQEMLMKMQSQLAMSKGENRMNKIL